MGILIRDGVPAAETREPRHMVMERPEKPKFQSPDKILKLRQWPGFIALAGARGCGKTEWLLSLASFLANPESPVYLSDLTGPRSFLLDPGVAVHVKRTMPDVRLLAANAEEGDPRLIKPEIEEAFGDRRGRVMLDVGSNAQGAAVIGGFRKNVLAAGCDLILVVNPLDPKTADEDNVLALKLFVEGQTLLPVTGIVANPYRRSGDEPRLCAEAAMSFLSVAQALDVPLLYVLADEEIAETVSSLLPVELPVWGLSRVLWAWEEESADVSG